MINGINLKGLQSYVDLITEKPAEAISSYGITAKWLGGVKTEIHTHNQKVGSKEISKDFRFNIDEPEELLGSNSQPTPQDYLFGGLAGCMMVGFVVAAAQKGIALESVELTIKGNLNLRGFLNIDSTAAVGFEEIEFHFNVKGSGTPEEYSKIIQEVKRLSPNYRTIADTVKLSASNA